MLNRQQGFGAAALIAQFGHAVRLVTEGPQAGWKLETQSLVRFHAITLPYGVEIIPHTAVTAIAPVRIATRDRYTRADGVLADFDAVVTSRRVPGSRMGRKDQLIGIPRGLRHGDRWASPSRAARI